MTNDQKATAIGLILAILYAAQPFSTDVGFVWKTDWFKLAIAVGLAAFGYITNKKQLMK